jgi:Bacterial Ig-like domain (group 2)
VTGVSEGNVTLTATSTLDTTKSGSVALTVENVSPVVTAVTIEQGDAIALQTGATRNLSVVVSGENSPPQSVNWSSSDSAVASVNSSGVVRAESAGTATITATSTYTSSKSDSLTVTVTAPSPTITGVKISLDGYESYYQEYSVSYPSNVIGTLQAEVLGENNPSQEVTWTLSNNSVINFNAATGQFYGIGYGGVDVIATSNAAPGIESIISIYIDNSCEGSSEHESNNLLSYADSSGLYSAGTVTLYGSLCSGDVDYYSVTIPDYHYLDLAVNGNGLDTILALFDNSGTEKFYSDNVNGIDPFLSVYAHLGNTYYFAVSGYGDRNFNGNHTQNGDYTVTVTLYQ